MPDPRRLASWLMLATGIAHVIHFVLLDMAEAAVGLGAFGVAYLAIGIWLRVSDGKAALVAGILVPALGGLGGVASLASGLDPVMLGYVVVDAVVVVICIRLLMNPPTGVQGDSQ